MTTASTRQASSKDSTEVALGVTALVSIWRHDKSTARDDFLCSGVFVGQGLILTVAHAVPQGVSVWVRPYVGGQKALRIAPDPIRHSTLDAALIRLSTMPEGASFAGLDLDSIDSETSGLTLSGFFEGNLEHLLSATWTSFKDDENIHLFEPKQPKGHSGSALARGSRVWGIATKHYKDADIQRGCAVSARQLWDGFLETHVLPSMDFRPPEPDRADVEKRARQIRLDIISLRFDIACNGLHDLATDFRDRAEIDRAIVISVKVRSMATVKLAGMAMINQQTRVAEGMLELLNDIVQRLTREVGP